MKTNNKNSLFVNDVLPVAKDKMKQQLQQHIQADLYMYVLV